MQGQCEYTPYMQSPLAVQVPFAQMPAAAVPTAEKYEEIKEEEDVLDDKYRQPPFGPGPFFGPRPPFFPPPFYGPRPPFFPPPFYGPRPPFFPPPFYGPRPPFYGAPFGFGFGLPFLSGLALGGLLF
jgi:hypothetical protein